MTQETKPSLSPEMSRLFDMALKLLLLLLGAVFGAEFQEVTKNVVLVTNLKRKLNFGIRKTALGNFVKIISIK